MRTLTINYKSMLLLLRFVFRELRDEPGVTLTRLYLPLLYSITILYSFHRSLLLRTYIFLHFIQNLLSFARINYYITYTLTQFIPLFYSSHYCFSVNRILLYFYTKLLSF